MDFESKKAHQITNCKYPAGFNTLYWPEETIAKDNNWKQTGLSTRKFPKEAIVLVEP